jgi:hypothetical protein
MANSAVLYLGKIMQQHIPMYILLLNVDDVPAHHNVVFESLLEVELQQITKKLSVLRPKRVAILNGKRHTGPSIVDCEEIPPKLVGWFLDSLHEEEPEA